MATNSANHIYYEFCESNASIITIEILALTFTDDKFNTILKSLLVSKVVNIPTMDIDCLSQKELRYAISKLINRSGNIYDLPLTQMSSL